MKRLLVVALLACSQSAGASSPPVPERPPPMSDLGQLDGTTWVKHDNVRNVTCWVYSYEVPLRMYEPHEGGISCLPDWLLQKPAGAP